MNINVNSLGYGNPTQKHLTVANRERPLIPSATLTRIAPKPNSSPETYGELLEMVKTAKAYDGSDFLDFVKVADEDMRGLFERLMNKHGLAFTNYEEQLFDDLASITLELKIEFNRIRPFQLARILDVPLNPLESASAQSMSYPSGHAFQATTVAESLAARYPFMAEEVKVLAKRIAFSRIVGGYHFPSDNEYSRMLAHEILPQIVPSEG